MQTDDCQKELAEFRAKSKERFLGTTAKREEL
jgi:hypothetical protein